MENEKVYIEDLKNLLTIIDFMASWINNIGNNDYTKGYHHVITQTELIRKKYKII